MKRLILSLVLVQSLVVAGLVTWWLIRSTRAPGTGHLQRLLDVTREQGAAAAVALLPTEVVQAGMVACHREACVQARFGGDFERLRAARAASGVDRCDGYRADHCTRRYVDDELERVLVHAHLLGCQETGVTDSPAGPRLEVQCRDVADVIPLATAPNGGYQMLGTPGFPGLLRAVYTRESRKPGRPKE